MYSYPLGDAERSIVRQAREAAAAPEEPPPPKPPPPMRREVSAITDATLIPLMEQDIKTRASIKGRCARKRPDAWWLVGATSSFAAAARTPTVCYKAQRALYSVSVSVASSALAPPRPRRWAALTPTTPRRCACASRAAPASPARAASSYVYLDDSF